MDIEERARRGASSYARFMALLCERQSKLEDLHLGLSPVTRTGDYSDIVVIDGDGRPIPWRRVCRLDQEEMRDLMREVTDKIYTFLQKWDDPEFEAVRERWRRETWDWGKPKLDTALMKQIEVLGELDGDARRSAAADETQKTS